MLGQSFEGIQWKQTWAAQKLPSPHLLLSAFHGTSLLLLSAKYFAIQVLSSSQIFESKSGDLPETGFLLLLNSGAILTKL